MFLGAGSCCVSVRLFIRLYTCCIVDCAVFDFMPVSVHSAKMMPSAICNINFILVFLVFSIALKPWLLSSRLFCF